MRVGNHTQAVTVEQQPTFAESIKNRMGIIATRLANNGANLAITALAVYAMANIPTASADPFGQCMIDCRRTGRTYSQCFLECSAYKIIETLLGS